MQECGSALHRLIETHNWLLQTALFLLLAQVMLRVVNAANGCSLLFNYLARSQATYFTTL